MSKNRDIERIIKKAQKEITEATGLNVTLIASHKEYAINELLKELFAECMTCWNTDETFLEDGSRVYPRPMMRKIFWLIALERYPKAPRQLLAFMAGVTNHTSVIRSLKNSKEWREVKDELFMKYYEPVEHLRFTVAEPEDQHLYAAEIL